MGVRHKVRKNDKQNVDCGCVVPFSDEEKKINSLFLSANFLENLGVANGKMGIVLYFFCQYRQKRNSLYEDFAFELLEEIDGAINDRTWLGFRYGLCGIGWGIEFLVRERYIGVEEDICARFEHRIFQSILYDRYHGVGIADGLCGILLYLVARIESSLILPDSDRMFLIKKSIIYALDKLSNEITLEKAKDMAKEQDNSMFIGKIPLVLSNWDYPVLLWVLGRIWLHNLLREKIEKLYSLLLLPLVDETLLPQKANNRELLWRILCNSPELENSVTMELIHSIIIKLKGEHFDNVSQLDGKISGVSDEFFKFTTGQSIAILENRELYAD